VSSFLSSINFNDFVKSLAVVPVSWSHVPGQADKLSLYLLAFYESMNVCRVACPFVLEYPAIAPESGNVARKHLICYVLPASIMSHKFMK
jgi:hypothetical protein